MEKFKVTMTLASPVVTGGGYLTLDALLAALLFDQTGDVEVAHRDIPLAHTNGLWHASAAMVEKLEVGRISFVANLHARHAFSRPPSGFGILIATSRTSQS
jgi:hypothetical protein